MLEDKCRDDRFPLSGMEVCGVLSSTGQALILSGQEKYPVVVRPLGKAVHPESDCQQLNPWFHVALCMCLL